MFQMVKLLLVFQLLSLRVAGYTVMAEVVLWVQVARVPRLQAGSPTPDPHSSSLHLGFATGGAGALGMLAYFHFLHHFPEGGSTTTDPTLSNNLALLGARSPVTR